ncbi:hypothetical protein [Shewanella sp. FJAT-52076]|uniref:hypothetical protein n=1 Tax=Shewanella sp. FJAT-52076 TaxID=2864202 RepID=UPI001C6571F3|nr:hypothetical protein [Shewanella sp. FJAT-52076]QYJ76460.1 hypothetical protein K0H79_05690 [Shewanella sp. FJAT-52076]
MFFIKLSRFASDWKVVELRPTPDQEGIYSNPLLDLPCRPDEAESPFGFMLKIG